MTKRMTMTRATHEACDFNAELGRTGSTSLFTRVEAEIRAAELRGQGFKTLIKAVAGRTGFFYVFYLCI